MAKFSQSKAVSFDVKQFNKNMKAMEEWKQRERQQKRLASLIGAGFDEAEAEDSLALYEALNDEAFEAIIAKWFNKKDKKKEDKDKKDKRNDEDVGDEELLKLIHSKRAGLRHLACQIVSHLDLSQKESMIELLLEESGYA